MFYTFNAYPYLHIKLFSRVSVIMNCIRNNGIQALCSPYTQVVRRGIFPSFIIGINQFGFRNIRSGLLFFAFFVNVDLTNCHLTFRPAVFFTVLHFESLSAMHPSFVIFFMPISDPDVRLLDIFELCLILLVNPSTSYSLNLANMFRCTFTKAEYISFLLGELASILHHCSKLILFLFAFFQKTYHPSHTKKHMANIWLGYGHRQTIPSLSMVSSSCIHL